MMEQKKRSKSLDIFAQAHQRTIQRMRSLTKFNGVL